MEFCALLMVWTVQKGGRSWDGCTWRVIRRGLKSSLSREWNCTVSYTNNMLIVEQWSSSWPIQVWNHCFLQPKVQTPWRSFHWHYFQLPVHLSSFKFQQPSYLVPIFHATYRFDHFFSLSLCVPTRKATMAKSNLFSFFSSNIRNKLPCHLSSNFFQHIFCIKSRMYPIKNPEKTQVIVGSMNMGFDIYPTLPGIELTTCFILIVRQFH